MAVKAVGKEFEQYAEQTTIHGIKDFTLTKSKPLKIAWGLFILGALGLMCEEIYRTTKNFEVAPTAMDVKIMDMDYYPTIYFWTEDWWDDTKARQLGFDDKNLAYISEVLGLWLGSNYPQIQKYADALSADSTFKDEVIADIKAKMQMHNLSTVEDMVNIVSWGLPESDIKRRYVYPHTSGIELCTVLHTIRFKFGTEEEALFPKQVTLPMKEGFIVVGEDPYGAAYKFIPQINKTIFFKVEVQAVNKVTVLKDRGGGCNQGYESILACIHDCTVIEKYSCMCNGTTNIPTYHNNESFWRLYSQGSDPALYDQCGKRYRLCADRCRPCTIWNYQVSVSTITLGIGDYIKDERTSGWIHIKSVTRMQMSTEYYTYKMASFLGDVGGLVSLFCGASVLSFVQLIMFCCGEGLRGKRKVHDGDQKLEERFHRFRNKSC